MTGFKWSEYWFANQGQFKNPPSCGCILWAFIRGRSLVYIASKYGHLAIVQWLVSHGADIGWQARVSKSTPLHVAGFFGHPSVVRFLVTVECRENIRNHRIALSTQFIADSVAVFSRHSSLGVPAHPLFSVRQSVIWKWFAMTLNTKTTRHPHE